MRSWIRWVVPMLVVAWLLWAWLIEESAGPAVVVEQGPPTSEPSRPGASEAAAPTASNPPVPGASDGVADDLVSRESRQALEDSTGLRLIDAQGAPLEGVALRVWDISVDTGDILGYLGTVSACDRLYLEPERTARIASAARVWTSDARGGVALRPGELPAESRLLVAIVEPGWRPWSKVLDSREQLLDLGEVRLEASAGCRVRVDGVNPAGGEVRVRAQALLPEGAVPESLPHEVRSRRALFHGAVLSDDNTAVLPRFEGRVALWAWQGDLRSDVVVAEQGAELRLTLQPTFSVSGTVARESGEPVGAYAHVVASRWDGDRRVWEQQATAMVGEGGRYGPLLLPARTDQRHRLSVRWTEAGEADRELGSPAAGEQRTEDFLLGPNRDVWIHVWGAISEQDDVVELPGARVLARWTRPSGGTFVRDKTTIASGWVRFGGIEPGDVVSFTASAEGFATSSGHAYPMTEAGIDPFNLVLQPAARRVVDVSHRGQPVDACLFVRSEKDGYESASATWMRSASEPGRFHLPPSHRVCWIRAVLPGIGASRPARLEPDSDGASGPPPAPLELIVLDGPTATGQVVDVATGRPVVGAHVALVEPDRGGGAPASAAVEATSMEGGLFELRGLPPESREQVLLVQADGYRLLRLPLPVLEVEGGRLDLGPLELAPELQLSLDVLERPGSVESFNVWGTGLRSVERRTVRPGERLTWTLVDDAVDLQLFFGGNGPYGETWDWIGVSAQGQTDRGLAVAYDPPLAAPLETGVRVPAAWVDDPSVWPLRLLFYPEDPAVDWDRELRLPGPDARATQPLLPPGGYQVRAIRSSGGELGRIEWRLESGVQSVELPFDEPGRRLQLTRWDGEAVEGAKVFLESDSGVGLLTTAAAAEGGWLEPRVHFQPVRASGVLSAGACFADVPVDWSGADQGEAVGFVEVGPFELGACLCEGALGPLSGVEWSLHPAAWSASLGTGRSDADGRLALPPMMAGSYRLELSLPGYWPRAVAVKAGESELRLWMARRSSLKLRLRAPDGEPLATEGVDLHHVELNAGSDYWSARGLLEPPALVTRADGTLTVDGLPEGTYRISARSGAWTGEAELSWPAGQATEVQLTAR